MLYVEIGLSCIFEDKMVYWDHSCYAPKDHSTWWFDAPCYWRCGVRGHWSSKWPSASCEISVFSFVEQEHFWSLLWPSLHYIVTAMIAPRRHARLRILICPCVGHLTNIKSVPGCPLQRYRMMGGENEVLFCLLVFFTCHFGSERGIARRYWFSLQSSVTV